eukprot:364628-Chlamydomonas_euryale.AAC.4
MGARWPATIRDLVGAVHRGCGLLCAVCSGCAICSGTVVCDSLDATSCARSATELLAVVCSAAHVSNSRGLICAAGPDAGNLSMARFDAAAGVTYCAGPATGT